MTRDQKAQIIVMFFRYPVWCILAAPGLIALFYVKAGASKAASVAHKVRLIV